MKKIDLAWFSLSCSSCVPFHSFSSLYLFFLLHQVLLLSLTDIHTFSSTGCHQYIYINVELAWLETIQVRPTRRTRFMAHWNAEEHHFITYWLIHCTNRKSGALHLVFWRIVRLCDKIYILHHIPTRWGKTQSFYLQVWVKKWASKFQNYTVEHFIFKNICILLLIPQGNQIRGFLIYFQINILSYQTILQSFFPLFY